LFVIDTRFDSNYHCSIFGNVVQRILDRLEITRPIRGNNDIRTNISHKKAQEAQK